jgi:hypothetical protein
MEQAPQKTNSVERIASTKEQHSAVEQEYKRTKRELKYSSDYFQQQKLTAEIGDLLAKKDALRIEMEADKKATRSEAYEYKLAPKKEGGRFSRWLGRAFRRATAGVLLGLSVGSTTSESKSLNRMPEEAKVRTETAARETEARNTPVIRMEDAKDMPQTIQPMEERSVRSPEDQREHEEEMKMVITENNTPATPEDVVRVVGERQAAGLYAEE